MLSIDAFCATHASLLSMELAEEQEQLKPQPVTHSRFSAPDKEQHSASSSTLASLILDSLSIGLYGKTYATFTSFSPPAALQTKLSVGDEVDVKQKSDSKTTAAHSSAAPAPLISGIISSVGDSSLTLVLSEPPRPKLSKSSTPSPTISDLVPPLSLHSKSSIAVHKKINAALASLKSSQYNHPIAGNVISLLFPLTTPAPAPPLPPPPPLTLFNDSLDSSQQSAISFSLNTPTLSLIHGPPGTGKTTALVELLLLSVATRKKILVCAPSNVAVDNLVTRLAATARAPVLLRLGHPSRLSPAVLKHSLSHRVATHTNMEVIATARSDMSTLLKTSEDSRKSWSDRRAARDEMRELRKDIRKREDAITANIIAGTDIVLATTVGAASRLLRNTVFDLVVIDEAAQAIEGSCWIPILKGQKLVLAGDHLQLPPTVKSAKAATSGLGVTLFDRAMKLYEHDLCRMLTVQYRMNRLISDWASGAMYDGKLTPAKSVADRTLQGQPVLLLVDTTGCDFTEGVGESGSRYNEGECLLVQEHVTALVEGGLKPEDIAVITPYNGQVDMLRSLMLEAYPKLEIRSVDGFQGGEKEAVVLSLVRSNEAKQVGFLKEKRRLNVAVTRAKRHCCIIGDGECVSSDKFLEGLVAWFEEHGEVRSAMEMLGGSEVGGGAQHVSVQGGQREAMIAAAEEAASAKERRTQKEREKEMAKTKALLNRISGFNDTGRAGETMNFGKKLGAKERFMVHELCEQLGLTHRSEGEGEERTITIGKEGVVGAEGVAGVAGIEEAEEVVVEGGGGFGALEIDDEDSEEEKEEEEEEEEKLEAKPAASNPNSLLKQLALERAQRQAASPAASAAPAPSTSGGKSGKSKKKKKKGGGGGGKDMLAGKEDLDDDALLDSMVSSVGKSHGRKITGNGGGYQTIMNGILNKRVEKPAEKRNEAQQSVLANKILAAKNDRGKKEKDKKKGKKK